MKIYTDEQRQEYMTRLKRLVDAIETYDKAKAHFEGLNELQTEVKGSLKPVPGYPPNPNLPRGQDFFSHIETMPEIHMKDGLHGLAAREAQREEDPNNLTPSESGMSNGRCPI